MDLKMNAREMKIQYVLLMDGFTTFVHTSDILFVHCLDLQGVVESNECSAYSSVARNPILRRHRFLIMRAKYLVVAVV